MLLYHAWYNSNIVPVIKGDCKGYVGSNYCAEVRDAMTVTPVFKLKIDNN
jgi:hypothetical protein